MRPPTEQASSVPAADVYLSYNSREGAAVGNIAKRLKQDGIAVWWDLEQLKPGQRWEDRLEEAHQCPTWVVFLGPYGVGPYHKREIEMARKRLRAPAERT